MKRDPKARPKIGRIAKLACVAWLVGLLSLPAILFAAGKRQPILENTAHAPMTPITLSGLTEQKTFNGLERNALEANPVRERALDVRARVFVDLLGASPSTDVTLGQDGFLFTRGGLPGCGNVAKTSAAMLSLGLMSEALQTAGAHTVVYVANSKLLAEKRHKPRVSAGDLRCEQRHEDQIEAALPHIPGGVSVQAALNAQLAAGHDVFLRDDTHWNGYGRQAVARVIYQHLLPERNRPVIGIGDPDTRKGDIARFAGFARKEHFLNNPATMPPGHVPLQSRRVVYIGDSQIQTSLMNGPRGPAFVATPNGKYCAWLAPGVFGGSGTDECKVALGKAKYVAIETVPHHLERIIDGCFLPLTGAVSNLKGRPATLSDQRAVTANGGGQALNVEVGGVPDVSKVDRVVRITIPSREPVGLGQEALHGPLASCATPAVPAGPVVFVVRAGDRLSDLRLGLTGPPGAPFSAQVIDLNGAVRGL